MQDDNIIYGDANTSVVAHGDNSFSVYTSTSDGVALSRKLTNTTQGEVLGNLDDIVYDILRAYN